MIFGFSETCLHPKPRLGCRVMLSRKGEARKAREQRSWYLMELSDAIGLVGKIEAFSGTS